MDDKSILDSLIHHKRYKNDELQLQNKDSLDVFNASDYNDIVKIGIGTTATVYKLTAQDLPPICKKIYKPHVPYADIYKEYENGLLVNKLSSRYTLFVDTYALTTSSIVGGGLITQFLRARGLYKKKSISPFKKYFKDLQCGEVIDEQTMEDAYYYNVHGNDITESLSISNITQDQLPNVINLLCWLAKDLHQDNWSTFKRLFRLLVNSLNNNTILIQYLKYDLFNLLKLHGWINTKYVLTKEKTQLLAEPGKTQLLAEPGLYTQYFPTNTAIDGDAVNPAQNWLYEGKKLPNSEIYSLFYQVAYVLSQIRDIFQHNDLKVDNILVYKLARPITFSLGGFEFSTYCVAKLIDYGVANKKETSDNTYCNRIYNMMLEMKFIDEDKHEAIMKQLKSQSLDVVWNDLLTYLKKNLSRVLTEKMIICNGTDDVKIQNFQPQRLHHPHWRSGGNKRLLKVTRKRRRFTKKN